MEYLLNINSRTIHDANSTNGRCKIKLMSEENKLIFNDYGKAKNYLPNGKKKAAPCAFCLGNDYETKGLTN